MISIDQILLLQQKVEVAVKKITELKSENDALRTKCSELTNALSEKTELLKSFQVDEKRIEDGILSALTKLTSVENNILNSASAQSSITQNTVETPLQSQNVVTQMQKPTPQNIMQESAQNISQESTQDYTEESNQEALNSNDSLFDDGAPNTDDLSEMSDSQDEDITPDTQMDIF